LAVQSPGPGDVVRIAFTLSLAAGLLVFPLRKPGRTERHKTATYPTFAHDVTAIIERVGFDPRRLVVEVTEGTVVQDRAMGQLAQLRDNGVGGLPPAEAIQRHG
jgi:hypothetical protein